MRLVIAVAIASIAVPAFAETILPPPVISPGTEIAVVAACTPSTGKADFFTCTFPGLGSAAPAGFHFIVDSLFVQMNSPETAHPSVSFTFSTILNPPLGCQFKNTCQFGVLPVPLGQIGPNPTKASPTRLLAAHVTGLNIPLILVNPTTDDPLLAINFDMAIDSQLITRFSTFTLTGHWVALPPT